MSHVRAHPPGAGPADAATKAETTDRNPAVITRPKFRMWLRPDGIVHLVWVPGAAMDLDDAIAATGVMSQLTGGQRSPLLVDVREQGPMDRAARTEFVRRGDLVSAVALVVGTPLSRLMANFFLAVSKPMAPTRLFNAEAPAVAWLRDLVE